MPQPAGGSFAVGDGKSVRTAEARENDDPEDRAKKSATHYLRHVSLVPRIRFTTATHQLRARYDGLQYPVRGTTPTLSWVRAASSSSRARGGAPRRAPRRRLR